LGRRYGQHFLTRPSVLDRIASAACAGDPSLVVEIGPGRGALTLPLLARAEKVVAIEVDPVLVLYLRQKFHHEIASGRLILVEGDVLKSDLGAWGPCAIAGNLPYYITSPILERLFAAGSTWQRAVFLVQAEVAARLAASPGSRDYGYLSVFTQVHARVAKLLDVPRAAFRPPPKVDSAVVELTPRDSRADLGIEDLDSFLNFAGLCFRHKRKTLRNNLAAIYPANRLEALPEARLRAEQLGIAELVRLQAVLRPA
jgi:16S rRNA (adenine1518-N6/adenine1519-N6)-dimethyltransferase